MPSSPPSRVGRLPVCRFLAVGVVLAFVVAAVAPFVGLAAGSGVTAATPTPATSEAADGSPARASLPHEDGDGNLILFEGGGASYGALDEFGDVRTAHRTGALRPAADLAVGDTLVVVFESERLGAEYADTVGPNATVRFFEALNASNVSLAVTGTAEPSCDPVRLRLRDSRTRALVDATRGEFRLLLDTEALVIDGGCTDAPDLPGAYEVELDPSARNETRRSVASFELSETPGGPEPDSDVEDISVRRAAPVHAVELRSAAAVRRGRRARWLVSDNRVVPGEAAVLTLRSERLARAYANTTGVNATARLLRAVDATGGRLWIAPRLSDDAGEPGATDESRIDLTGPGVRTLPDVENGTFHLVLRTDAARMATGGPLVPAAGTGGNDPRNLERDMRAVLVVPGASPERYRGRLLLIDADATVRVAWNRSVELGGGRSPAVVGRDGQFLVLPGTNLAPDSRVTLRVRSGNRTLATRDVRILGERPATPGDDSGRGAGVTSFDLGSLSVDQRLTLSLVRDGSRLTRVPLLVGAPPVLRNPTVRRVADGPEELTVQFAVTARYPGPGYVVVRNRTEYVGFRVPADEPTRVTGTVTLPSRDGAVDESQSIRLIAVYDGDQDGVLDTPSDGAETDPAFDNVDGGLLARSATLPEAPTVTPPPPGTTIAVEDGQPGFGMLAMLGALVVLAAAGARSRRR